MKEKQNCALCHMVCRHIT